MRNLSVMAVVAITAVSLFCGTVFVTNQSKEAKTGITITSIGNGKSTVTIIRDHKSQLTETLANN